MLEWQQDQVQSIIATARRLRRVRPLATRDWVSARVAENQRSAAQRRDRDDFHASRRAKSGQLTIGELQGFPEARRVICER
ncbi:MAG: hypothetical protein EBT06_05965 [Gammaproteobacteria bacterium]|nr:hypothetical protein [Gammaproteobacteria bacterium]NBT44459.1 hypothetical protein [Gammaproteobacteria bacterium]NBY21392.1 hypothetical protein [Gammaproteobacteria bacterium]NDE35517.1 hypothetical protein [Gammaproteobacteria bacterium]NDE57113.1 hypothetical protein [Gammaproteobacteria bacterium]